MICTPLISLDLETTSLEPAHHAPWEIAWQTAVHTGDALYLGEARSFMLHVPPDARADPIGLDIGGFWNRWRAVDATRWVNVQRELLADLASVRRYAWEMTLDVDHGPDGAPVTPEQMPATHLVGAVPQFDHRMLERWLGWSHRHWHYHLIDVETLCAGKLGMPPPYDTDEITRVFLPDWDDSHKHEAAADVRWNLALYAAAYDLYLERITTNG